MKIAHMVTETSTEEAFISQDKAQKILDDYITKLAQDAPTVADFHVRCTADEPASKKQKTSSY